MKSDLILANPPFNISDWGGERLKDDVRWKYGVPPVGNANYGWIQHMIHHLALTGIAGFVLANGSLSTNTSGEGDIRQSLITNGLVDCIVALRSQLFYTTQIPACLWFVSRDRYDHRFRNRHDEILFIDARKMGTMVTRKNRELTDEDLKKITGVYHAWRTINGKYEDVKGFRKVAKITEVEKNGFVLTPGCYVGSDYIEEDDGTFEDKMTKITAELGDQFKQSKELEDCIKKNLKTIGFEKTMKFLESLKIDTWWKIILLLGVGAIFMSFTVKIDFIQNKHLCGLGIGMLLLGISYWIAEQKFSTNELPAAELRGIID